MIAGGGTAGHIEPAMNFADQLMSEDSNAQVLAVGTVRGLDTELIPRRGYELALIEPVPFPRRPNRDLISLPFRLSKAKKQVRDLIATFKPDVIVGFGGYVALPVYLAAKGRVPIVVHEANAHAGLANKVGARFANVVAETVSGSLPHAQLIGIPLRHSIANLDCAGLRSEARKHFGLPQDGLAVFAFGGSQGSVRINQAIESAVRAGVFTDINVLHSVGAKNNVMGDAPSNYVGVNYIDRMDLAYAACDFIIARSGAMTVAEVTSVGLPACYVPYPVGNGEQKFNALPVVNAGAAILIDDADFTAQAVAEHIIALIRDPHVLYDMASKTQGFGSVNAAAALVALARTVVTKNSSQSQKAQDD